MVQVIVAAFGAVTVHPMVPAGLYPPEPVTRAVRVVVPPRVGEEEALIAMVGVCAENPIVRVLEARGV